MAKKRSPKKRVSPITWLRNSFLAGVALVLPFVVTGLLIWWFVSLIDDNVVPRAAEMLPGNLANIAKAIPGAGVVIAVATLTIIGALAGNLFARMALRATETVISNLPLVRSIYGGAKQVFGQVAAPERTSFRQAVLVEFPKPGSWALGFVTNENGAEIASDTGQDLVAVYVPQAPIPTSGFLLYLNRNELKPINLSPEEALKRVISLGIIRNTEDEEAQSLAPER